ncbi:MAG: hypothetical protein ACU0DW_02185 [Shimia sp.]
MNEKKGGRVMAEIGHNGGPSMERGHRLRAYQWRRAREALVPTLPLMILRRRVARAQELGLDYTTYAGVRASTGRDVIGFLFSDNALRLKRMEVAEEVAVKLAAIREAGKVALIHAPAPLEAPMMDVVARAPVLSDGWPAMRDRVVGLLGSQRLAREGVLVVGETALERAWSEAGRTAGYLEADRYFGR